MKTESQADVDTLAGHYLGAGMAAALDAALDRLPHAARADKRDEQPDGLPTTEGEL